MRSWSPAGSRPQRSASYVVQSAGPRAYRAPAGRMACAASQVPADVVKQQVLGLYSRLPKTGKPQAHEHTVLAGFAVTADGCPGQVAVVALGTGTKCLPASKRSRDGTLLHDSHAEVIARRALLSWMYHQLHLALQQHSKQAGDASAANLSTAAGGTTEHPQDKQQQQQGSATAAGQAAFTWDPQLGCFHWRPGLQLHMYISQPPCGDASIFQLEGPAAVALGAPAATGAPIAAAVTAGPAPAAAAAAAAQHANEAVATQPATAVAVGAASTTLAGRTGAKLIKLGGAADVAGAPSAECPPGATTTPASSNSPATGSDMQELAHKVRPQQCTQHHPEQQQEGHVPHLQPQQAQGAPQVPQAHEVESGPQQLGALRRKPGRGEATLSMSCSDKMARWACLGLQGALLSSVVVMPLYLDGLVVSAAPAGPLAGPLEGSNTASAQEAAPHATHGDGPESAGHRSGATATGTIAAAGAAAAAPSMLAALQRALVERLAPAAAHLAARESAGNPMFKVQPPSVAVATPVEEGLGLAPSSSRKSPSGFSISWSATGAVLQHVPPQQHQQQQHQPSGPAAEAGMHVAAEATESGAASIRLLQCPAAAGEHEVTLGAVGTKAGAAKSGGARASAKVRPRLCAAALAERFLQLVEQLPPGPAVKQQVGAWQAAAAAAAGGGGVGVARAPAHVSPSGGEAPALLHLKEHVAGAYMANWKQVKQGELFAAWLPKTLPGQGL